MTEDRRRTTRARAPALRPCAAACGDFRGSDAPHPTPAGLAFALYTAANLAPRALSRHAWYRARFPEYPPRRKALLPFLL